MCSPHFLLTGHTHNRPRASRWLSELTWSVAKALEGLGGDGVRPSLIAPDARKPARTWPVSTPLTVTVRVRRARPSELPLPRYQTPLSAGMDLLADVTAELAFEPLSRRLVPTGLSIELPEGFEAQVRPRSGLAAKQGLTCLNSPGTIDADYRGEVQVLLVNLSSERTVIRRGDRIAQLVVAPVVRAELTEVEVLSETARGAGGFGSTGR